MSTTDYNAIFCGLIAVPQENNPEKKPSSRVPEAQALIDAGRLDFNWTNARGQTVLGVMLEEVGTAVVRGDLMMSMLAKGCNPLNCPDPELSVIFNDKYLRDILVHFCSEQERRGCGLRDSLGGNLYHVMARVNCWQFGDAVVVLESRMPQLPLSPSELKSGRPERLAWIHQGRDDGSTPLHVLWSRETLDHEIEIHKGVTDAERTETGINSVAIYITSLLVELGCDMLEPNQAGVRAWDLMEERNFSSIQDFPEEETKYGKLLEAIRASAEGRILESNTPAPKSPGRMGTRL